MVTAAPAAAGGPASALRTLTIGSAPTTVKAPAARPERRKKVRRSSAPPACDASAPTSDPRRAWRSFLLINMCVVPSARIAVDAIEGLHGVGFFVPSLGLLIVVLGVGASHTQWRRRRGDARTGAKDF